MHSFLLPLILFRIPNLKCPPLRNEEEEEEGEEEESDAEEELASGRTRSHRNSVVVVVGARVSRVCDSFGAALKLQSGTESKSRLCL